MGERSEGAYRRDVGGRRHEGGWMPRPHAPPRIRHTGGQHTPRHIPPRGVRLIRARRRQRRPLPPLQHGQQRGETTQPQILRQAPPVGKHVCRPLAQTVPTRRKPRRTPRHRHRPPSHRTPLLRPLGIRDKKREQLQTHPLRKPPPPFG